MVIEVPKFYQMSDGYIAGAINGKTISQHAYLWIIRNGPIPAGYEIHHKDENRSNNTIDNLELVTRKIHSRIHSGWIRNERGEWILRKCHTCGETKSLDHFRGRGMCRECKSIWNKAYRKTHKELYLYFGRKYRALHKDELNRRRRERKAAIRALVKVMGR